MTTNLTPKKVLLVEDEKALLDSLTYVLSELPITVLTAQNGNKALETARSEHPDLIITDLSMPQKDGMNFIAELRADAWGNGAHIIILSNFDDVKRVSDAVVNGVTEYFVKSAMVLEEMVKHVKGALDLPE